MNDLRSSINGKKVEITDSTLSGYLQESGKIEWSVNIVGSFQESEDELVDFNLYIEQFEWNVASTDDFLSIPIRINDGAVFSNHQILPGGKACCLYIYEHEFLEWAQFSFHQQQKELFIKLQASRQSSNGAKYEVDITTRIDFLGINLGKTSPKQAQTFLPFNQQGLEFYQEDEVLYLIPPQS